jgi:hypothetical protein
VTDRPKLSDRGSPERCPVGNLHQIFSDRERVAYITEGCTQATITCVECKALAVPSVNAHLAPIRERRRELVQHPAKLQQILRHGAEKAAQAAEKTMVAVRQSMGLLQLGAVEMLAPGAGATPALRVPDLIASAQTEDEKWTLRTAEWLERVTKIHPLKQDRKRTFITRKGRKVGLYAAEEENGTARFVLEDRPLNVLVLLVQKEDRLLHDFVLPPKVLQEHWKQLRRQDGNVLIDVIGNHDGAALRLAEGSLAINSWKSDYSALQ